MSCPARAEGLVNMVCHVAKTDTPSSLREPFPRRSPVSTWQHFLRKCWRGSRRLWSHQSCLGYCPAPGSHVKKALCQTLASWDADQIPLGDDHIGEKVAVMKRLLHCVYAFQPYTYIYIYLYREREREKGRISFCQAFCFNSTTKDTCVLMACLYLYSCKIIGCD